MSVTCDLPPSALFVRYVVAQHQPVSHPTLSTETGLPDRTLARALKRLRETNRIIESSTPTDARHRVYTLPEA